MIHISGTINMSEILPQCKNLQSQVNSLLELLQQEPSLRLQLDTTAIETSLQKAIDPRFEVVFAGAFSAGKSMLINALLGRELLYSAEGHATGTQCNIEYAEPDQERVVLTFLSEAEIRQQMIALCHKLDLDPPSHINQPEVLEMLHQCCDQIILKEGGESKSEKAKQAKALILLLDGYKQNRDRIKTIEPATYTMEQFNFSNLSEAATYARRGNNSSVLKKLHYYCHHPLLKDGNILVDMPGIDAPVKKDADLTYQKIQDPDTSAVICVLKPASAGDMTSEETELLEKMRSNLSIRDRVFYVFNRIDETWYNAQLRQRLDTLINSQFQNAKRVYKTSGLLGFYGTQIKNTTGMDRFGLNSIFAESVKGLGGEEETPQFVSAFNNYCANSSKLTRTRFKVTVNGYDTPNENYVRILSDWGIDLIDQLITDSGINEFSQAVAHYLTAEKRPQLFSSLADDLQPLCINLKKYYLQNYRELDSQPREIEVMKAQELARLTNELQGIGEGFYQHISEQVNTIVVNGDPAFEQDFEQLKARMVSRLDELLQTFSVANAYSRATSTHPRNATAPLLAILVEALYYLANQLEDLLVESLETLVNSFSQRLIDRVRKSDYYRQLYRLLGNDGGIEQQLKDLQQQIIYTLKNEARVECDRYVRESPRFYDEGTFSIYQFRQTLQQTSQGYDCNSMLEAEPAIRQLLRLDFEPKLSTTVRRNFRQTINQTLKTQLLPMAEKQSEDILQHYNQARAYLEQSLEQEATEQIATNQRLQSEMKQKIDQYNQAVMGINGCLQARQVYERQLPVISDEELLISSSNSPIIDSEDDIIDSEIID
jgi:replication fork clamp-binding protein CrfC